MEKRKKNSICPKISFARVLIFVTKVMRPSLVFYSKVVFKSNKVNAVFWRQEKETSEC